MFRVSTDAKVRLFYELANISKSDERVYTLGVARLIYQTEKELSRVAYSKMISMRELLIKELKEPALVYLFTQRTLYRALIELMLLENKRKGL